MINIAHFLHPLNFCSSPTSAALLAEHHKHFLSHPCGPSSQHHPQWGLVLMLKAKKEDLYTGREVESPFLSQSIPPAGVPSEFRQPEDRPKLFL